MRSFLHSTESSTSPHPRPLVVSIFLHGSLVLTLVLIWLWEGRRPKVKKVDFEVFAQPKLVAPTMEIDRPPPPPQRMEPPPRKAVFGVAKKALVSLADSETGASAVNIKYGNTVAKEMDSESLQPGDEEALPLPADDFLVTQMPKIQTEFRIPYPPEAKAHNIEGPVVMDLLIDSQGRVRQVVVVSGPGYGLNEAAAAALKQFLFVPAAVKDQNVAVKIRYTYRFVLESR